MLSRIHSMALALALICGFVFADNVRAQHQQARPITSQIGTQIEPAVPVPNDGPRWTPFVRQANGSFHARCMQNGQCLLIAVRNPHCVYIWMYDPLTGQYCALRRDCGNWFCPQTGVTVPPPPIPNQPGAGGTPSPRTPDSPSTPIPPPPPVPAS